MSKDGLVMTTRLRSSPNAQPLLHFAYAAALRAAQDSPGRVGVAICGTTGVGDAAYVEAQRPPYACTARVRLHTLRLCRICGCTLVNQGLQQQAAAARNTGVSEQEGSPA